MGKTQQNKIQLGADFPVLFLHFLVQSWKSDKKTVLHPSTQLFTFYSSHHVIYSPPDTNTRRRRKRRKQKPLKTLKLHQKKVDFKFCFVFLLNSCNFFEVSQKKSCPIASVISLLYFSKENCPPPLKYSFSDGEQLPVTSFLSVQSTSTFQFFMSLAWVTNSRGVNAKNVIRPIILDQQLPLLRIISSCLAENRC